MIKRRSPRKIIESTPNPEFEHAYVSFSNQPLTEVTQPAYYNKTSGITDVQRVRNLYKGKPGRLVHTHPSKLDEEPVKLSLPEKVLTRIFAGTWSSSPNYQIEKTAALHSPEDLKAFLYSPKFKSAPIAVRNPDTGEVLGYNVLIKTKKTPSAESFYSPLGGLFTVSKYILNWGSIGKDFRKYNRAAASGNISETKKAYEDFLEKYGLKHRFVPMPCYELNETQTAFVKSTPLESRVSSSLAVVGLLGSLFFSANNLTGNVITNTNQTNYNLFGIFLFLVGIISAIFYFRRK